MENNKTILAVTSVGVITAEKLTDPDNPGIVIGLKLPDKDHTEIDLVVVENTKEDGNINMYVYDNVFDEDWQRKITVKKEDVEKLVKQFNEEGDAIE